MSKPWDNERTTWTEANKNSVLQIWYDFVDADKVANLERRLRHAERLLESTRNQIDNIGVHIPMDADTWDCICAHLEAAKKEDWR